MRLWRNGIQPVMIKALVYAAVISAIVAVPMLIAIMKIANYKKLMQSKTYGRISNVIDGPLF